MNACKLASLALAFASLAGPLLSQDAATSPASDAADSRSAIHETDEQWREAAQQRIERHRKANLEIRIVDAAGKPVPNATVDIKMTRHAFGFGALINTTRWQDRPNAADARRHLTLVAERFNKVVMIPKPGEHASDVALDWLTERGIKVRGHYLMWAPVQPGRERYGQPRDAFTLPVPELIKPANAEQRERVRKAAFAHIEKILTFAGSRVSEWDAVNHIANDAHVRFSDIFGVQIYADVINYARQLAPHAEVWVNEGNVLEAGTRLQKYHDVVAELIATGTKPDGLGFMSHFREGEFTQPAEIYRRLDWFAELVPNLQLTELDIDCGDEQLQADYTRDVLTVAFSHPAVSGIVMWQVWGEAAGRKALWRSDWSIKPAGQAWIDQVFGTWWTNAAGATSDDGRFVTRGFLGNYDVRVSVGRASKTIPVQLIPEGKVVTITF